MVVRFKQAASLLLLTSAVLALGSTQDAHAKDLRKMLRRKMADLLIPGLQYAVIRQHRIITQGALGTANIQDKIPVTPNTIFPINSITKAFTGVALMQLVEASKLDLDAPISRYLDGLPVTWQDVTIRRLATHTSGLPDVWDEHSNLIADSPEAAWKKVLTLPLDFAPGAQFKYNQTNYVLLGKVIDKLAGEPFAHFVARRQFRVAGMPLTGYHDGNDVVPHSTRVYSVYRNVSGRFTFTGRVSNGTLEDFAPYMRTAAGINSTATEVARWIIALQKGQLIKKSSLHELGNPGRLNDGSHAAFSPYVNGYGIGWPMVLRPNHRALTPTGGGRSAFFWYPEDDLAIVVITNLTGSAPDGFIDELAGLYIPDLRFSNGFFLSPALNAVRLALRKGVSSVADVARKNGAKEIDINQWGYGLLAEPGQTKAAIDVFKLNVLLFPRSANVYDSLAEACEAAGQTRRAIENYRRSLQLDPKSVHSTARLKALHARLN